MNKVRPNSVKRLHSVDLPFDYFHSQPAPKQEKYRDPNQPKRKETANDQANGL